ncbi:MAG: folate-binding protein [Ardenticatenia bacterium]|nr:folate-binding protein [Ardenticatenia bacterium]
MSEDAFRAALEASALFDMSHWGRLHVGGQDRLRFLHNMTTAAFEGAGPGEVIEAVVLTAKARMIDLVTAVVVGEHVGLITSPERRHVLPNWFRRFIFFNDDVHVTDVSEQSCLFILVGPQSDKVLDTLLSNELPETGRCVMGRVNGEPVLVAAGSGLGTPGYRLLVPAGADAKVVWASLVAAGARHDLVVGDGEVWEQLRVWHGRPAADHEITEEYNPLEAGLWHAIRFDKGCYIGQEVVARLDTYRKIKQHLMRVDLEQMVPPGGDLMVAGQPVGRLTSAVETPLGPFGLAYIRREAAQPGVEVLVRAGDLTTSGQLSDPQFVRRERPPELP